MGWCSVQRLLLLKAAVPVVKMVLTENDAACLELGLNTCLICHFSTICYFVYIHYEFNCPTHLPVVPYLDITHLIEELLAETGTLT